MTKLTLIASCLLLSASIDTMAQNAFLERGKQAYNRLTPEEQAEAVRSVMAGEKLRVQQTTVVRKSILPDSLENAKTLRNTNNNDEAYRMYARMAAKGDLEAMTEQGTMQIGGNGTPADVEAGSRLVREAANKGSPLAAQRIGFNLTGTGQIKEGWGWFELAAERGDPLSQVLVGHRLEAGPDVKHDFKEAVRWYKRAATSRYAQGFFYLAQMYEYGKGVKKNKILAAAIYPEGQEYDLQRLKLQSTLSRMEKETAETMHDEIYSAPTPLVVIEAFEIGKKTQR